MATENREIAQNLAIACLNHRDLAEAVLAGASRTGVIQGKPEILGERLGEFYGGIYKAVEKAGAALGKPAEKTYTKPDELRKMMQAPQKD